MFKKFSLREQNQQSHVRKIFHYTPNRKSSLRFFYFTTWSAVIQGQKRFSYFTAWSTVIPKCERTFLKKYKNFCFFRLFPPEIQEFLKVGSGNFFRAVSFVLFCSVFEHKNFPSEFFNLGARKFRFMKYIFFCKKYENFFRVFFFFFFFHFLSLGQKERQVAAESTTRFTLLVNDSHMEELVFYWIQYKNSSKYSVGCFWRFSCVYTIN